MTPAKLAALRALAEAATPGPWNFRKWSDKDDEALLEMDCNPEWRWAAWVPLRTAANAAYIAALSPDVALELVAEVERLKTALKRVVDEMENDERQPLEPTCNECTQGHTPAQFDKGPCPWHQALAALSTMKAHSHD